MVKQYTYRELKIVQAGLMEYREAWELQTAIMNAKKQGLAQDFLLLVEHPHTFTLGKVANRSHLLLSDNALAEKAITVFDIDRGGDITYHGPGQLVGYPILDLKTWKTDSHLYLRSLEETIIRALKHFGLQCGRKEGLTGVWIGEKKIAAIGIKISSWITMHGFALNVNTDLSFFEGIIPCGITDKTVTSLEKETGHPVSLQEVTDILIKEFMTIFNYPEFAVIPRDSVHSFFETQDVAHG